MMNEPAAPPVSSQIGSSGRSLKRLEFEMALDIGGGGRPAGEILRQAAEAAGGDLLFLLPSTEGGGVTGIVRLQADGERYFMQVRSTEAGYAIAEGNDIDSGLLGFARASIDVLERLQADERILEPLKAMSH